MNIKKHLGLIVVSVIMLGVAIWWYTGKGRATSELMPIPEPPMDYTPSSENFIITNPSIGPISQNLNPYPIRMDYPFPVTPTQQLNLPAYQGHLARVHLSSEN